MQAVDLAGLGEDDELGRCISMTCECVPVWMQDTASLRDCDDTIFVFYYDETFIHGMCADSTKR